MGTCASVPSDPSWPQMVWRTFGAVAVLPIQPKLKVFSVVVKYKESFAVIGDLGSLCVQGDPQSESDPRSFLQNQIDNNYGRITVSEELGSIDLMAANDSRWSSKLLVLQTGVSAGFKDVHRWRIRVPRFQSVSTDEATLIKMVEKFVADNNNPHFPRGKALDVWIVSEVITAPSLSFYAFDQAGANIGLSLPPLAPLPVDLQVGLEGEVGAQGFFFRRGPELGGTVQPLPFAFRGWKYKLHNGWLKKPKRARYQADSFDAFPPNTAPIRNAIPATPSADPDMADFVGGDEWVTTIVEAEDPAQL